MRSETITWTGACDGGGYAAGEGTLTWFKNGKTNQQYFGQMKRGKPNGMGKYVYSSGSVYEGEYVNGELHGKGHTTTRDDDSLIVHIYKGMFNNGKQHGYGEEIYFTESGKDTLDYYLGDFYNDERHGPGMLKEFDDDQVTIAKGNFNNGKLEGKGEIQDYILNKLFNHYIGNFENGKRNGYGEDDVLGNKYLGNWKDDKKNGVGKLLLDSILIYDGDWKNDQFHGIGKRYFFDGCIYFGEFRNNVRDGVGVLHHTNGTKYIGEFKNDLYSGLGYMIKGSTILFAGYWQNGSLFTKEEYISVRRKLKKIHQDKIQRFDVNLTSR